MPNEKEADNDQRERFWTDNDDGKSLMLQLSKGSITTNKGCILVVDDTSADLEMLAETLTMEGYQVLPATSGVLALAAVAARPPELILLDIHMQALDGFEVCRQLKAQPESRDIPIVFISSSEQSAERVEGLRLGIMDFITKPYQREELLARIQILLELSRLRMRLKQHTEQELLASSSHQEALLAVVPEVIMEVDNHKIYTWANQAGFAFFGDDVIGKEAAFYFVGEQQTYATVQSQIDSHQDLFCVESWQRRKDGEIRLLAWQCRVLKDETGNVTGFLSSGRDITEQERTEKEREQVLLWQQGLNEVQQSLLMPAPIEGKLRYITDSIVRLFKADFCRIWLIRPGDLCARGCVHAGVQEGPHTCHYRDRCLHLLASSGRYTHIDGKVHRRVPFGAYKIGRIAADEGHRFLTNDATNDPRVHNHEWARDLGLISFAGYQLRIPGVETLGVLALFAKHPILPAEDTLLDALSSTLALSIQQAQAEEALRKSGLFLNKLLEAIPIPVFYKDRSGRYTGINKSFETFFGKSKEELIGKSVFDLYPIEFAEVYHSQDLKLFEKPIVQVYASQMQDARGIVHDVIFHKASLTDGQGSITGLIGAILDVTERKQAEDTLREKDRLLSESQRLGHIGSWYYDLTGPMSWSEELYHLFGVSPDSVTPSAESLINLIHPDDRPAMQTWIGACAAGEKPDALEFRIIKPDGTIHFIRGDGEAVFDDKNVVIYLAGSGQDITERKLAEEELRRYSSELEKNNRELLDALANVKQLSGLLPICASCKQIRDDGGYWQGVEMYISEHSNAEFSHGICPECEKKAYEELDNLKNGDI
jgi:PAS domain S-box-containing protein